MIWLAIKELLGFAGSIGSSWMQTRKIKAAGKIKIEEAKIVDETTEKEE